MMISPGHLTKKSEAKRDLAYNILVETETKDLRETWKEIKKKADRQMWRVLVAALCAHRHEVNE